jgi:hypothetical protein
MLAAMMAATKTAATTHNTTFTMATRYQFLPVDMPPDELK